MKRMWYNIFSVTIIIVFFAVVGCHKTTMLNENLMSAEQLMADQPDSALYILQNIDTTILKSAEDKALYALLYVQAEDKNYIDSKDVSKIQTAVTFYRDSKDEYHKMLSYYYMARIEENAHEYSKSIVNLLKAEDIAKAINSYFYLGLIYRSFSDIYNSSYNNVESLNYAQKAYKFFQLAGYTEYIDWGLWDIGKAYHNCADYDNSIEIAREVVNTATHKQDTILLRDGLRLLATSYVAQTDYASARKCYNQLRGIGEELLTADDHRNLGVAYFGSGDLDSARLYMEKLFPIDSTQRWLLYQWNKHVGNYKDALLALEKEHLSSNAILHKVINQNVTHAVNNYKNYEKLVNEKNIQYEKTTKIIITCVFIAIIILGVVIATLRIKSQKKEIENNILLAANLRNMLKNKEYETVALQNTFDKQLECKAADNIAMQEAINSLFEQRFATIDRLTSAYYEYQGTSNEKNKIYVDVMKLVSGLGSDKKTLKELESFINTYKDNLLIRFRNEFPDLRESDYVLYIYTIAGFSSRAISIFIGEKLEVVYNRKSRLKQKINKSNSNYKSVFISHL